MKRLIAVLVLAVPAVYSQGQNLVVNPGFEQHSQANSINWLSGGDMFSCYSVKGWSQPTNGSSDYFFRNDGGAKMNITPYAGEHEPATGNAFAGFINWVPGREYREYITGELTQPLVKGKKYAFRMKICTGKLCPYLVNDLGVYFSEERFTDKTTQFCAKEQAQVWLDATPMQESPETWVVIQNAFVASGNEKFFTFGSFVNDSNTTIVKRTAAEGFCEYAYYYCDDIIVELTTEEPLMPGKKTALSDQIAAGKTFIARGINFDLDKATLRPESYLQIHEIASELKRKPNLKVDIRGYTDSTGNEAHNLQLSKARAKVVADYLISIGIDKSRITYGGYGSADPVSSFDPALNRRVEFVFR